MENQLNSLNIPPHKSLTHWLVVAVAIIAVIGYFMASYAFSLWPFGNILPPLEPAGPVVGLDKFETPLPIPSQIPSDWKTYTNTEYGFEFKYPESHTAYSRVDQEKEILIPAKSNDNNVSVAEVEASLFCCEPFTLNISVINQTISLQDWFNQNRKKYFDEATVKSEREIEFQGHSALEVMGSGYTNSYYKLLIISKDGYLIVISQHFNSEFLNQILSTFKLVNKTDTSTWKTYINTVVGYSLKYPKTYTLDAGDPNYVFMKGETSTKADIRYRVGDTSTAAINSWFDSEPIGDITLGGIPGKKFIFKYCDGPGCGPDIVAYVVRYNNKLLGLEFIGDRAMDSEENQILSTFRFVK